MKYDDVFWTVGVCLAIIIVFGIVGNVLSVLVWTIGKQCKNSPTAVYLAVSDTLVLSIPAVELSVYLIEPILLLRNLHPVFCIILPISPYFWKQISTWILICLTTEQTMAVCRPFQSIASHSKWRQYGLVVFVTVISFLDNLIVSLAHNWDVKEKHTSHSFEAEENNNSGTAILDTLNGSSTISSRDTHDAMNNTVYNDAEYHCALTFESKEHIFIVQVGFLTVLPLLILSACNILITVRMFRRDKKLALTGSDGHEQTKTILLASMTARTFAISFVQCATSIPMLTLDIYVLFKPRTDTIMLVYTVCNSVTYLNHAINVVFYCLLGRSFRRDCVELFIRRSTNEAGFGPTATENLSS